MEIEDINTIKGIIEEKLEPKKYEIKDIEKQIKGFIIFSKEKYKKKEKEKLFKAYKNEKCLKNIYENMQNIPCSRYFYIEEITNDNFYKTRKGILTYIMLNPSYASSNESDPTMNRARKWATMVCNNEENVGFKYFAVINLYSYRHHCPNELKRILSNEEKIPTNYEKEDNISFIKKYLETKISKDFVLAFGNNDFDERTIINLIKSHYSNCQFKTFFHEINEKPYHLLARKKVLNDKKKVTLQNINVDTTREKYIYEIK
ncbi:DUF1643 domain-containing protein [bacterium]|nr:DUF1643 domain-containing protein [bacterium]